MSPTNATSSPRDHQADSNPDLARKKQRLSEDQDESSADDTVVVEACEPEDIGTNLGNAIEIEDEDDENIMVGYSRTYEARSDLQPLAAVGKLLEEIESGRYYLQVGEFRALARWLWEHCNVTKDDGAELWQLQYLEADNEFFRAFARLALVMLNTSDLFDAGDIGLVGKSHAIHEFFFGISQLACRIIPLLPDVLNSTFSRRDSALQGSTISHKVELLKYLSIAARSLPKYSELATTFRRFINSQDVEEHNVRHLSQPKVLAALGSILRMLAGDMRQIKDSWVLVQDVLRSFAAVAAYQEEGPFPNDVFDEIMEVVSTCTLPAVCAKHPGALPPLFHDELIYGGQLIMRRFSQRNSHDEVCKAYERFIKSDEDAILHEHVRGSSVSEMLAAASVHDNKALSVLIADSWTMQAAMSYIRSDIMNIRSIGLAILSQHLHAVYRRVEISRDFDDIHVQHAVRFLRKNEVTKYIFSSESHASLVSESQAVISFLSATKMWTDQETDVIWRACSTSVEADFVKASFHVLLNQLPSLDFGHVLHLLKKYGSTDIDGLGPTATTFLPSVLRRLEEFHHGPGLNHASRVELALSTIDILKRIDRSKATAFSSRLRNVLHNEIGSFASSNFSSEDRRQIYAKCLPDIEDPACDGTTATEVLTILLSFEMPQEDAESILSMLPVSAAVADLENFVRSQKDRSEDHFRINCVCIRLSCILRLMSLERIPPDDGVVGSIFRWVFGENALGEHARGAAWDKLNALTGGPKSPAAAISLWRVYMQRYVPSLPAKLASPRLIELISSYLADESAQGSISSDYALLLQHPLWATLVRFATTSTHRPVIDAATVAIGHFLFSSAAQAQIKTLRDGAIKCQQETVRQLVESMKKSYVSIDAGPEQIQSVLRCTDLLHALLFKSREFVGFYAPASDHDLVVLDKPASEADRLSFTMEVYSPDPQPQVLTVSASKTTTVSELLASLPSKTGAADSRIIAGGREITGLTTQTLSDVGIQNLGVIQIRPRYTQDFDFDHLLMGIGPIESEIVAHFDFLESLVDGPTVIAEKAMNFLSILSPPNKARYQVVLSKDTTACDLFPNERPSRALFSIHVLRCHLQDCARLGIAEANFLKRGVRLLTTALMNDSRGPQDLVALQLIHCMRDFLQGEMDRNREMATRLLTLSLERPSKEDSAPYFENGAVFATHVINKLLDCERSFQLNSLVLNAFAINAYSTLLLASQVDQIVWQSFSADQRTTKLHAFLLLQPDINFSEGIARAIRGVCQNSESANSTSDFFWTSLIACMPDALKAPERSFTFFGLISEVLHMATHIQADESRSRALVEQLSEVLWNYRHKESMNELLRDDAMAGLLKLLREACMILKSFKKSLQLDGLSSKVAEQLLFASEPSGYQPVVHDDTRAFAYDLLRITLETSADFERIVDATGQMIDRGVRLASAKFPGLSEWRRNGLQCSGLENLGMTCYMNSLLQQLFGNTQFRKFVLDQPIINPEKQLLLQRMQSLFAKMQSCVEPVQNPNSLAQALGIQIGNQEDVHDFYASLVSRLEVEMPDGTSRMELSKFFTGQSITQIRGECGHVSSQKEAFGDLSVTVKNKANLHDSLAEFVQGEPMEGANKYKCMSCDPDNGRLVDAMRRTCLEEVPDCLTVCLKRFTFGSKFLGEGKVNDRFDFPETVDMSQYKRTHLEAPDQPHDPDIFELAGVIVHQGSLNLGHYWSYVRVPNLTQPGTGDWYYLEDTKTLHCPKGFKTIQQECFGGQQYSNGNERADNAYVLFYQRKQYFAEAPLACGDEHTPALQFGLPKVSLSDSLVSEVDSSNWWRQTIAFLFDAKFANHVCWLLNQYPAFKELQSAIADPDSSPTTSEQSEDAASYALDVNVATLMTNYVLRVLLADPAYEVKLSQTTSAISTALLACPRLPQHILGAFATDGFGFETTLCNEHPKLRRAVFDLLLTCIERVREQGHREYMKAVGQLLKVHASLLRGDFVDRRPYVWSEYFQFPSYIAKQGPDETGMVLKEGYFNWIIEVIWITDSGFKQKHQPLSNMLQRDSSIDLDTFFVFLNDLLSEHVDLSDLDCATPDVEPRRQTSRGWALMEMERKALSLYNDKRRDQPWIIFDNAFSRCRTGQKAWQDFGFGKMLGLLVSEKADPRLRLMIKKALVLHYKNEQYNLPPLLYATLHYCANTEDGECNDILEQLGKTLPGWTNERKCLLFLSEAYKLVPRSVIDTALTWATNFLTSERESTRQCTAEWLKDHVLVDSPISGDNAFDVSRVKVARALAKTLDRLIKEAYNNEHPKNRYASAVDVLQILATYISTLAQSVAQAQSEDVMLPVEILVQNDELRTELTGLGDTLATIEDWTCEPGLPMRSSGVRPSVEIDETDEMVSDEEDLDDCDVYSQSI